MDFQMKEDKRDIFSQWETWFRNTLEWMGAAYRITGLALWGHHSNEGCERAEPGHGALVAMTSRAKGVARAGCVHCLGFIALSLVPRNIILTLSCWAQPQLDTAPPTLWAVAPGCAWLHLAAGRASTLLLLVVLLTQQNGELGATGEQGDVMVTRCTVSLLNAAVTRSCLSPCIAAALPACPDLPQHTRLPNPSSRVHTEVCSSSSSPHTSLQNMQLFWWEMSSNLLLAPAVKT